MDKLTIAWAIYRAATPENLEELQRQGNAGPIADAVLAAIHSSGVGNKSLNHDALVPTPDRFGEGYRAGVEASARVAEERAAAYSAIPRPHLLNAARLGEAERIATAIRALQPATGDEA